jgi:DNA polymerase-3 subunit delta
VRARPLRVDDLSELRVLPGVVLVVGDEELLVSRAVSAVTAAARAADPALIETETAGSDLVGPELHELLGPSLFGDSRLVVIAAAQDVKTAALQVLQPYLQSPEPGTTIVLQHPGGAKGKAVLEAARTDNAIEIACVKLSRPEERLEFVRSEARRSGATITPEAVAALVDSVGSELRELAAACTQLVGDSDGRIDIDLVRAFHRGRAEVTGFAVADLAVTGRGAEALETLRYALDIGVAAVLVADALADGIRSIARVASAGRADPYALASKLGMPPWKVKRASAQSRGWTEAGVRQALGIVAGLNADVKGEAADAGYALERAVSRLVEVRGAR